MLVWWAQISEQQANKKGVGGIGETLMSSPQPIQILFVARQINFDPTLLLPPPPQDLACKVNFDPTLLLPPAASTRRPMKIINVSQNVMRKDRSAA